MDVLVLRNGVVEDHGTKPRSEGCVDLPQHAVEALPLFVREVDNRLDVAPADDQ